MLNKILGKLRGNLKSKKGFTLIELIVVIAIIAILIALIAPNVLKFVGQADDTAKEANAKSLYIAASTYQADAYANPSASNPVLKSTLTHGKAIFDALGDYLDSKTLATLKAETSATGAKYTIEIDAKGNIEKASWDGKSYGNTP